MKKRHLVLDFETGSECDISAEGGWRYSKHPSTRVYCLAYTIDNQAPKIWLPPKEAVRYLFNVRATHKGLTGHFSRVKGKPKKTTKKRLEEIKNRRSAPFTWPERFENLIEGKGIARRGWNWEGSLILPVWAGYKIKWRPDFLNLPLIS